MAVLNGRVLQPISCPVCHMPNRRDKAFSTLMRNLDHEGANEYQCGFCGSIFWWSAATRQACGIESRYPFTRQGWDKDVKYIDPKWVKGDPCPRCKEKEDYKEDFFMGNQGRCIICNGTKIYPGDI